MIHFPNDVKIKVCIEQGSVYNFSPQEGVVNHYYVVLNKNPQKDSEIYLAPFTTKRDSVLRLIEIRGLETKTLVLVEEGECSFLRRRDETSIDCNRLMPSVSIDELVELINGSNGNCNYPKVEKTLMSRVIEGVNASRMVSDNVKKLL